MKKSKAPKTKTTKRVKYARVDTGVHKGHFALFTNGGVISGECRWTGKKYKDGTFLIEITYTGSLPSRSAKKTRKV